MVIRRMVYTPLMAVVLVGMARAGVIGPDLAQRIAHAESDEMIATSVLMVPQVGSEELEWMMHGTPLLKRRERVIARLKRCRDSTQVALLQLLREREEEGAVEGIRSLWLGNMVRFSGTPDVIKAVSVLDGIERMHLDEERQMFPAMAEAPRVSGGREIVWSVAKVQAPQVWALGYRGEGIVISVMDTGVRYSHRDLEDHIWTNDDEIPNNGIDDDGNGYIDDFYGYDFCNDDGDPMDDHGHGTHCAGTIAGDGSAGCTTGVAPDARIMSCKTVSSAGYTTEALGWEAMQYAFDNGALVIAMPYGWLSAWNPDRQQWRNSCNALLAGGMVVCVLSGAEDNNYGPPDNVRTPGDCPPPWLHPDQSLTGGLSAVVTVGATDQNDVVASFSSRGPVSWESIAPWFDYDYQPGMGLIDPDITAPGIDITSLSAESDSSYAVSSGTSWAAAHVPGALALMLSKNGMLSPEMMDSIIEMAAVDLGVNGKDNDYGAGRLDCYQAIQYTPAAIVEEDGGAAFPGSKPQLCISPNPFTAVTSIKLLGTSRNEKAVIVIYGVSGRVVRCLSPDISTSQLAAEVIWNGCDERGKRVSPGIYFVKLITGATVVAEKIMFME